MLLKIPYNCYSKYPNLDDHNRVNSGAVSFESEDFNPESSRQILKQLVNADIVGGNFWKGIELPSFLRDLIALGKAEMIEGEKDECVIAELDIAQPGSIYADPIYLYHAPHPTDTYKNFAFTGQPIDFTEPPDFHTDSEQEAAEYAFSQIYRTPKMPNFLRRLIVAGRAHPMTEQPDYAAGFELQAQAGAMRLYVMDADESEDRGMSRFTFITPDDDAADAPASLETNSEPIAENYLAEIGARWF